MVFGVLLSGAPVGGFLLASVRLPETIRIGNLSQAISRRAVHELIGLGIAAAVLLLTRLVGPAGFRQYFRLGDRCGPVKPVPLIGLKPKPPENWSHVGRTFAVIITAVTAVVIFLKLIRGTTVSASMWPAIPFVLLFSVTNAFSEGVMVRFALPANLPGHAPDGLILAASARNRTTHEVRCRRCHHAGTRRSVFLDVIPLTP